MSTWKKLCFEDDAILKSFVTAKGDLISASASGTPLILPIGSSGQYLSVGGSGSTGLQWTALTAVAHNLFSTTHSDTAGAASPVDGDIIIGNATPAWSKLAISVPSSTFINHLAVANGETRPSWKALFDSTVPGTIAAGATAAAGSAVVAARRDHTHGAPSTWAPSSHALSAHTAAAANISMAGYQLTNLVMHQVADATARAALTAVVGKVAFQLDTLALYICTAV